MDKDIKEIAEKICNPFPYRYSDREAKRLAQYILNPWIPVSERLPEEGEQVLCCYVGVYSCRLVTYWHDGINQYFGLPGEPDGRGSQPATHWIPLPPAPDKE